MNVIDFLRELNNFLDKSFIFKGYKFLLAFYLTVIVLTIVAIIYRIGRLYWAVLISGQGTLHIRKGSFYHRWKRIDLLWEKGGTKNQKVAILEAAQLLNDVLSQVGYKKELLGEKLAEMSAAQLTNIEDVRWANELKNKIVKEDNFVLKKSEAERALKTFEEALDFFEAI